MGRIELATAQFVVGPGLPRFVTAAINDIRAYVRHVCRAVLPVRKTVDPRSVCVRIIVDPTLARSMLADFDFPSLGQEGYVLTARSDRAGVHVIAQGHTACGTKFALAELLRRITTDGRAAWIEGPLNVVSRPCFSTRGLHLNGWLFNHPYSFRAWHPEDWRRYIDLAAFMKVNVLVIWPFMEIIPVPITRHERDYFREIQGIVEYAQRIRGMKVWIMAAANRVCNSRQGISDPRKRPYWNREIHVDLNPGDPRQRGRILAAHETLHRQISNMDGFLIIDSDPGGYPGSPSDDFVDILAANRGFLDRYNVHGSDSVLVPWLLDGWGIGTPAENVRNVIRGMKRRLDGRWLLVVKQPEFMPVLDEEAVLDRTVYLPYDLTEQEPSVPFSRSWVPRISEVFRTTVKRHPFGGVMCNVQTPVLQIPNVLHFQDCAWDIARADRKPAEVEKEIARLVLPKAAAELAHAWSRFSDHFADPDLSFHGFDRSTKVIRVRRSTRRLVKAIGDLEKLLSCPDRLTPGPVGWMHLQNAEDILADLSHQGRMKFSLEELLRERGHGSLSGRWFGMLKDYLDMAVCWQRRTGYMRGLVPENDCARLRGSRQHGISPARRRSLSNRLVRQSVPAYLIDRTLDNIFGPL